MAEAAEGVGADQLGGLMDWPLIDWEGGQYREVIASARRFLEGVVRRGPEFEAARAGAILLAAGAGAGAVPDSSRRALAARFSGPGGGA